MNYKLHLFSLLIVYFASVAHELMSESWQCRFNEALRSDMDKFDNGLKKRLGMGHNKLTITLPEWDENSNALSFFPRVGLIPHEKSLKRRELHPISLTCEEKIFLIGRLLVELSNFLRKGLKRFIMGKGICGIVSTALAMGVFKRFEAGADIPIDLEKRI